MSRRLLLIAFAFLLFPSCHVGRFFLYNFSDVRDYKKFPSKPIMKSDNPFYFIDAADKSGLKLPQKDAKGKEIGFEKMLQENKTIAFLFIRNDSILYDWVRPGYKPSAIVPSFSIAKTFVSVLIGIAIDEGFIKNSSEPITNYLPAFDKKTFGKITIQHLLDMRSGIKFNESYINPFGEVAKYYYGNNLRKFIKKLKTESEPGGDFNYKSVNSQLLGMILENATGKTPTQYLQEKIWTPLGMEFDASWSVDSRKNQTEKGFCCINARAKDFAKLGRLYLNKGNWNGKQVVSENWVNASVNVKDKKNNFIYTNQWWHTRDLFPINDTAKLKTPFVKICSTKDPQFCYAAVPTGDFFAQGHLGQFVYVYPEKKIIIVRLGKKEGEINWSHFLKEIAIKN